MYGINLPADLMGPLDPAHALDDNDTFPSNIDPSAVAYIGEFP